MKDSGSNNKSKGKLTRLKDSLKDSLWVHLVGPVGTLAAVFFGLVGAFIVPAYQAQIEYLERDNENLRLRIHDLEKVQEQKKSDGADVVKANLDLISSNAVLHREILLQSRELTAIQSDRALLVDQVQSEKEKYSALLSEREKTPCLDTTLLAIGESKAFSDGRTFITFNNRGGRQFDLMMQFGDEKVKSFQVQIHGRFVTEYNSRRYYIYCLGEESLRNTRYNRDNLSSYCALVVYCETVN